MRVARDQGVNNNRVSLNRQAMVQVFIFLFHRFTLLLRDRIGHVFAAALDKNMSLIQLVFVLLQTILRSKDLTFNASLREKLLSQ